MGWYLLLPLDVFLLMDINSYDVFEILRNKPYGAPAYANCFFFNGDVYWCLMCDVFLLLDISSYGVFEMLRNKPCGARGDANCFFLFHEYILISYVWNEVFLRFCLKIEFFLL